VKLVFDTNVYVSSILHGGLPSQVFRIAIHAGFAVYVSAAITDEIRDVLQRHGVRSRLIATLLHEIRGNARPVKIQRGKRWVPSLTEADNHILATAVAANADYPVTGDRRMRAVGRVRRTQIVTPRQFITALIHAGYLVRGDF
jgi:putative PIN family toxin of toxin-antitoxin system